MQTEAFLLCVELLNKIVDGETSFHDANTRLKQAEMDPLDKNLCISYLGSSIRNYVSCDRLIASYFSHLPKSTRLSLIVALMVLRHGKNEADKNMVKDYIIKDFGLHELDNYLVSLNNLFSFVVTAEDLIPGEVKANSLAFLSSRYGIPFDILKMWVKQFGHRNAFRSAMALNHRHIPYYRINSIKTDLEGLKKVEANAVKETEFPELVIYRKNAPLRKTQFGIEGLLFKAELSTILALREVAFNETRALIFTATYNPIALEVLIDFFQKGGKEIELFAQTEEVKYQMWTRFKSALGDKRSYFRVAPVDGLNAHVHHKYDRVVYIPESTNFNDASMSPELLLTTDLRQLTILAKDQLSGLHSLSEFVDTAGEILYFVPTLSLKESKKIIETFLEEKTEFRLVHEKQYFPYEKGGNALYFALLKKDKVNDDA